MPSVSRAERRVKLCRRRRPWALASSRDELRHSILDHPDRARAPPRTPPESIAGGVRTGGEGGSRGPRRAAGTRTVVTPPHTSTATWRRSSIQRVQRIQTGGARRTGFTISGTIQTNHPPRRAAMAPRRGPQSRDPGPRAGQPGWSPAAARSGPLLDRVQHTGTGRTGFAPKNRDDRPALPVSRTTHRPQRHDDATTFRPPALRRFLDTS